MTKNSIIWSVCSKKWAKVWSHIAPPKKVRTHAHRTHISECISHAHVRVRPQIARVRARTYLRNPCLGKKWPTEQRCIHIEITCYKISTLITIFERMVSRSLLFIFLLLWEVQSKEVRKYITSRHFTLIRVVINLGTQRTNAIKNLKHWLWGLVGYNYITLFYGKAFVY